MSNLRRISKQEYYEIIKDWAKKYGKSPSKEDFDKDSNLPNPRTLEECIKIPWNKALKDLGLKQIKDKTYYKLMDNKELLKVFKEEYIKIQAKNRTDFNKRKNKNFPSCGYIEKRLNTKWNGILNMCNLKIKRRFYTKEEYTTILKKLQEDLGKTPSIPDFESKGYSLTSLLYVFNKKTYNEVINELGFINNPTPQKNTMTKKELIKKYKNLCNRLGYVATSEDINNAKDMPKFSLYTLRFTDIKTLRKLAGVQGKERKNIYETSEIINILKKIYKEKGRLNTNQLRLKIKEGKLPSITTIERHLKVTSLSGIWNKIEKSLKKY